MLTGISIYRVADGKLVEGWTAADLLSLLQQLGVSPMRKSAQVPRNKVGIAGLVQRVFVVSAVHLRQLSI